MEDNQLASVGYEVLEEEIIVCNWNEIDKPGLYVDVDYPRFFRVPEEEITPDGTLFIQGSDFEVARISANPFLNLIEIQHLCDQFNLPIP